MISEILKGFPSLFSDGICQKNKTIRRYFLSERFAVCGSVINSENQYAVAFAAIGFNGFLIYLIIFPEDKFRCAKNIGNRCKGGAAVLISGRK